jgi:hypothetical protein
MAFSTTQRTQVRMYLGYPSLLDSNTDYKLESMLDTIGSQPSEQATVEAILTELATLDAAIATGSTTVDARGAVKRADEVEFFGPHESGGGVTSAKSRARTLCGRLSMRLGVPLAGDYFGTNRAIGVGFQVV